MKDAYDFCGKRGNSLYDHKFIDIPFIHFTLSSRTKKIKIRKKNTTIEPAQKIFTIVG